MDAITDNWTLISGIGVFSAMFIGFIVILCKAAARTAPTPEGSESCSTQSSES